MEALLEETLGVAVFLTVGFKVAFALDLLGTAALLCFSTVSLETVFVLSAVDFFPVFDVGFLGLSLTEDGFLVAVTVFLAEAGLLF